MNTRTRELAVKVPQVTLIFWVAKLATTMFGEAFSDFVFFNDYIGQHLAMLMGLALLAGCLVFQFRTRRYTPVPYWATVTAVSIFGTMSADFLNKDLGMPLWASTVMLLVLQAAVFVGWSRTEHTLDVHDIINRRREAFYWLTVLFTFALGTAAGDFAADTLALGTLASAGVFAAIIAVVWLGYRRFGMTEVLSFWLAYSLTRPLGASIADWLGVPAPYGDGLQLGTGVISAVTGVVLLGVITVIVTRHHRQNQQDAPQLTTA